MNKVTKVTAAIAACAGMFAFTACGSSSAETGGDVELNIWGGVQADQGFNKVIEGFEEANPGIKVNYTRFTNDPTGNTKLDTALIADDSIDMFFTYSPVDFAKRAGSGIPLDLSEVDEDGLLDKVEDANIKYDGKYYGIPTSNESYNIVYNKTAFERLGITIPANWTWDEFMEIARKATHEENGKTVYGLAGVWHNIERQIYGGDAEYTKDGESPNFSDKGWTIKQKYYDMLFKDKSAYPFTQIMAKKIYNYESQLLLTGDALMAFYSPWMSRSALNNAEQYPRDFKMGFAPCPRSTFLASTAANTTPRRTTGCRSAPSPSTPKRHTSSSSTSSPTARKTTRRWASYPCWTARSRTRPSSTPFSPTKRTNYMTSTSSRRSSSMSIATTSSPRSSRLAHRWARSRPKESRATICSPRTTTSTSMV